MEPPIAENSRRYNLPPTLHKRAALPAHATEPPYGCIQGLLRHPHRFTYDFTQLIGLERHTRNSGYPLIPISVGMVIKLCVRHSSPTCSNLACSHERKSGGISLAPALRSRRLPSLPVSATQTHCPRRIAGKHS